jgi:TonB family protein
MMKLRALAFCLVMALSQVLPVPLMAPAWAQGQAAPAAPAPAPANPAPSPAPAAAPRSPSNAAQRPSQGYESSYGVPSMGADVCKAVPLARTQLPPSLDPPAEWRDKHVSLYVNLHQDGSVADIQMLHPSGSDSLDMAAMAQVKQSWHWASLDCGRPSANAEAVVVVRRLDCNSHGWTPGLPLALAQSRRSMSASVDMMVEPDGRMRDVHISDSSGDAALDAAVLAHIQQNWHLWPLEEGCPAERKHVHYRFPEKDCIPQPVLESRTMPADEPSDRPRAVDLQMGVAPDGKLLFTSVIQSSGDASLDAAAMAHVKAAWRWQPITCKRTEIYTRGSALPVIDMARITFPTRERSAAK